MRKIAPVGDYEKGIGSRLRFPCKYARARRSAAAMSMIMRLSAAMLVPDKATLYRVLGDKILLMQIRRASFAVRFCEIARARASSRKNGDGLVAEPRKLTIPKVGAGFRWSL